MTAEPAPRTVITVVAAHLGRTLGEVRGPRRLRPIVRARAACCLALRRRGLSYPAIGMALGGKDHSSAIMAVKRAVLLEAEDAQFADAVRLGVELGGRPRCAGPCDPRCPECGREHCWEPACVASVTPTACECSCPSCRARSTKP